MIGMGVGAAAHVPARAEGGGIEPEPAQERDPQDRDERQAHGPGLERPTTRGPRILAKVSSQITPAVAKTLAGGVLIPGMNSAR